MAFVLGGLNFTTRDYARFGQMILKNGEYGGKQVVPADAQEGGFFERGIYSQYIYFDQPRGIVITTSGADSAVS